MIFPQFVIYVLIYDYLKFSKDPSITFQEIVNYINFALAVTLSVYTGGMAKFIICKKTTMLIYTGTSFYPFVPISPLPSMFCIIEIMIKFF